MTKHLKRILTKWEQKNDLERLLDKTFDVSVGTNDAQYKPERCHQDKPPEPPHHET